MMDPEQSAVPSSPAQGSAALRGPGGPSSQEQSLKRALRLRVLGIFAFILLFAGTIAVFRVESRAHERNRQEKIRTRVDTIAAEKQRRNEQSLRQQAGESFARAKSLVDEYNRNPKRVSLLHMAQMEYMSGISSYRSLPGTEQDSTLVMARKNVAKIEVQLREAEKEHAQREAAAAKP